MSALALLAELTAHGVECTVVNHEYMICTGNLALIPKSLGEELIAMYSELDSMLWAYEMGLA